MPVTEKQISELEIFFAKAKLPTNIQLDKGSRIGNVRQFVDSHLKVLRYNSDKPAFDAFYNRLLSIKELVN